MFNKYRVRKKEKGKLKNKLNNLNVAKIISYNLKTVSNMKMFCVEDYYHILGSSF